MIMTSLTEEQMGIDRQLRLIDSVTNHNRTILKLLQRGEVLTNLGMVRDYSIMNLPKRISELRKGQFDKHPHSEILDRWNGSYKEYYIAR